MSGEDMKNRAFSLIEVLIVVVILGVLAAIALPQFASATDDARTAAVQSTLSGVRSSIASYRTSAVINGTAPYPALAEITDGSVLKFDVPINPFTDVGGVQAVTGGQADARAVVSESSAGWNYFVDNNATPPVVIFYSNTSILSTAPDGAGGFLGANEL
ncbi:MAG: prepilin-type N-terminal cleavage/methylation domain-containing protein [Phycisphaerales bacterium]|nr:prepilin-type N-terminal cleavage/methylation domain-containing protein [Phycisphaerales bacterium]